jgi:hypothetical protein
VTAEAVSSARVDPEPDEVADCKDDEKAEEEAEEEDDEDDEEEEEEEDDDAAPLASISEKVSALNNFFFFQSSRIRLKAALSVAGMSCRLKQIFCIRVEKRPQKFSLSFPFECLQIESMTETPPNLSAALAFLM